MRTENDKMKNGSEEQKKTRKNRYEKHYFLFNTKNNTWKSWWKKIIFNWKQKKDPKREDNRKNFEFEQNKKREKLSNRENINRKIDKNRDVH